MKVGGEHDVEISEEERKSRRKRRESGASESREGKVIEVDISDILSEEGE